MMGAWVSIFGAVVTIAINFIFIPKYGYIASAWANFICYFLIAILSFVLGQRYWKIDFEYKRIIYLFFGMIILYIINSILVNLELTILNWLLKIVIPTLYLLIIIKIFDIPLKRIKNLKQIVLKQ